MKSSFLPALFRFQAVLVLALWLQGSSQLHAQSDIFMRFVETSNPAPPIGDSNDPYFHGTNGWFRLRNFRLGVSNPGSSGGGSGQTAPIVKLIELSLQKGIEGNSPLTLMRLGGGTAIEKAEIAVRDAANKDGKAYVSFDIDACYVLSQNWSGGGEETLETVSLSYLALKWTVRQQSPNGLVGPGTKVEFDPVNKEYKLSSVP